MSFLSGHRRRPVLLVEYVSLTDDRCPTWRIDGGMSSHHRPTYYISVPGHRRPTRPFDVSERLSYVKYIIKVNCGREIVGGGPLEVRRVLSPGVR